MKDRVGGEEGVSKACNVVNKFKLPMKKGADITSVTQNVNPLLSPQLTQIQNDLLSHLNMPVFV